MTTSADIGGVATANPSPQHRIPAEGETVGKGETRYLLRTHLATRVVAADDDCTYEHITTWIARPVPAPGADAAHVRQSKPSDCIIRVFDEHYVHDPSQPPFCDAEPGDVRVWEEELMMARHLQSQGSCSCVLDPLPPYKIYLKLATVKRAIVVYARPEGDDWTALTFEMLVDQPENYTHVRKAMLDAIQALFDVDRHYITYDDYRQVLYSPSKHRCIFLNLALVRQAPPDAARKNKFDPKYELPAWAFPTQRAVQGSWVGR